MLDRRKYLDSVETKQLRQSCEARCLLDLSRGRRTGVMQWMLVDFALSTGLRVSEMSAVKLQDIDLKLATVSVSRRKRRKPTITAVALSKGLIVHLRAFYAWRERLQITDDHLFAGQRGPLTSRGLQQMFKAACRRAGMRKDLHVHSCRHTYGMSLYANSKDLRLVQVMLGHASPAITAAYYVDVPFSAQKAAVDRLYE